MTNLRANTGSLRERLEEVLAMPTVNQWVCGHDFLHSDELARALEDAARWQEVLRCICHSFDGENRTYYLRVTGRTELLPPSTPRGAAMKDDARKLLKETVTVLRAHSMGRSGDLLPRIQAYLKKEAKTVPAGTLTTIANKRIAEKNRHD